MRPAPRWGGWVAVLAIPYLSVAVMNLMSGPAGPVVSSLLAIGAVVAFFAGLDWTRRRGFSLR
jgi:uncharacterized membrane protein (DUF2068 family)